ncbi:MAG: stage IV sporulation protein A [Eubacteriaceae bacterium]|nr:stage IV sporulation protein A [Eubacteriaceae bacterium]
MDQYNVYNDIKARTNGEIYIGIVGAVRTGKSTFIKNFMEQLVIPNISNRFKRERAIDELPQSGSGKTIMTCEPKFVPNEAVNIRLFENTELSLRLIDCVGYIIPGALGAEEDGQPRMVNTPWSATAMPFEKAAEMGTKKVISEHSTIGIVMATDGSITDIPREDYIAAEERVISELKRLGKPFVIVLNSTAPKAATTVKLAGELKEKYATPVITLNAMELTIPDIDEIMQTVLLEFPVEEISFKIPKWAANLTREHWLMTQIEEFIDYMSCVESRIRSVKDGLAANTNENFSPNVVSVDLSCGHISTEIAIDNTVFYKIMSEENDINLKNETDLFSMLTELLQTKKKYDRFNGALSTAYATGYGIVYPTFEDLRLSEPEMTNEAGKYGIKLKADATALHILSSEIESEISPSIGSEAECENFYNRILAQYEGSQQELWQTEIFGRKLSDMLTDNIVQKLSSINDDTKNRIIKVVDRVSNNKKGGLFIFWL